jgi:hypothetical protein
LFLSSLRLIFITQGKVAVNTIFEEIYLLHL